MTLLRLTAAFVLALLLAPAASAYHIGDDADHDGIDDACDPHPYTMDPLSNLKDRICVEVHGCGGGGIVCTALDLVPDYNDISATLAKILRNLELPQTAT